MVVTPRFDGGRGGASISFRGGSVYVPGGCALALRLCDALDPGRVTLPRAGDVSQLVTRLRRLASSSDLQRADECDKHQTDVCGDAMLAAADALESTRRVEP